jgi:hypothetical protein
MPAGGDFGDLSTSKLLTPAFISHRKRLDYRWYETSMFFRGPCPLWLLPHEIAAVRRKARITHFMSMKGIYG